MGPEGLWLLLLCGNYIPALLQGPPSLAWIQRKSQPSGVWGGVHWSGSISLPALLSVHGCLCLFYCLCPAMSTWLHIRPADTRHSPALFIDGGQAHRQERCISLATEHSKQLDQSKRPGGGRAGAEPLASGCEAVSHRRLEILDLLFPIYQERGLESKKTKAWPVRRERSQKPNGSKEEEGHPGGKSLLAPCPSL